MKATLILLTILTVLATVYGAQAETYWIDEFTTSQPVGVVGGGGAGDAIVSEFKTSKEGNTFTVVTTISNPVNGKAINGVIELQARKSASFLSFLPENSCNPDHPWNVNGKISLSPGGSQVIKLTSDITLAGKGVYDFYLVSVNRCCVGQSCDAIQPFGWETLIAKSVSFGSGEVVDVACSYDFECDKKLKVEAGQAVCVNPRTPESYCAKKSKTDDDSGNDLGINPLFLYGFGAFLFIVVLLIFVVAVRR